MSFGILACVEAAVEASLDGHQGSEHRSCLRSSTFNGQGQQHPNMPLSRNIDFGNKSKRRNFIVNCICPLRYPTLRLEPPDISSTSQMLLLSSVPSIASSPAPEPVFCLPGRPQSLSSINKCQRARLLSTAPVVRIYTYGACVK
jgi:hypothetical protein